MKKTISLILIFGVLLILPLINSQLTFEPNEPAEIKLSCFDIDSGFCDATTTCNITVFSPNMTAIVDDQPMTNNINYFNYTTPTLFERGEYNAIVSCNKSGTHGYTSFAFVVTSIPATGQGIVAVGILLSLVGLSFLFIFIGFKFSESEKLFPIALFFILVSLILVVYTLHLGYVYNRDILVSSMTTSGQSRIYIGIMYGLIGMAFLGLLFLIVKTLKELRVRKSLIDHGEGYNPNTKRFE